MMGGDGARGGAAADQPRKDANQPWMIEVRRLRVERVRRVQRLGVAESHDPRKMPPEQEQQRGHAERPPKDGVADAGI